MPLYLGERNLSMKWRRSRKHLKWLDLRGAKSRSKILRVKTMRTARSIYPQNYRSSQNYAKRKWKGPKPLIDIFQEKNWITIIAEIAGFNKELESIVASAKEGQEEVIGSTILQKRRDLELKIHRANREKREIQMKKRERIDGLGQKLQNANTLTAPAVILVIAVVLGIRRSVRKRHYISHASDA